MEKTVKTVLGAVAPERVGTTSMHEHILWLTPGWQYDPKADKLFDAKKIFEKIRDDLIDYKSAGGQTIVDCSGIGLGRDVDFYAALSKASGVNIVACTGFWADRKILPYFALKDVDYLTELFVRELTRGMGATNIKAGVIKVGNSKQGISEVEEKTYRAAARASRKTGAAVITHGVNFARKQLELLLSEGAEPDRIVISHCDAAYSLDFKRDVEIARQGAYVGYDHVGIEPHLSRAAYAMGDDERLKLCRDFIDAGYAEHLVLSCDVDGFTIHERRTAYDFKYSHLLRKFVPMLEDVGIPGKTLDLILVETPRKILSF